MRLTSDLQLLHDAEKEGARVRGQRVVQLMRQLLQVEAAGGVCDGSHTSTTFRMRYL